MSDLKQIILTIVVYGHKLILILISYQWASHVVEKLKVRVEKLHHFFLHRFVLRPLE